MVGLAHDTELCIALKPQGEGWSWWVIDSAGGTVLSGTAAQRSAAEQQLRNAYEHAATQSRR